jgi:formate-dependent nitrite reductase membrane component NrfD
MADDRPVPERAGGVTDRPNLTRVALVVAGGRSIASVRYLVGDLGRPEEFLLSRSGRS